MSNYYQRTQHGYIPYVILFSLISLTLSLFPSLSSVSATTEVVDTVTASVPIFCTLNSSNTDHFEEINPGNHVENIGLSTLTAFCNDMEGFSIYAIGYSNDEDGNTNLIGDNTDLTINTGSYTSGDTTSSWSMKLSAVSGTYAPIIVGSTADAEKVSSTPDFSDYVAIPNSYTRVAYKNSGTDQGAGASGSSITTTYSAFISSDQPADVYDGKVKYTLVHPVSEGAPLSPQITNSGKICYYPNGGDVVGTMGCQTLSDSNTSYMLLASNFSREGYGFAGWSNKYDYATNPDQEGIKFYGPQEQISFTAGQYTGTNNGLSLYAVWVPSAGSLQDTAKVAQLCGTGAGSLITAPTDGTANLSSVSALTDQRDNQTYAIAKLADGNCWMIENLRLESRDTVGQNRFNSSITNESLAQGYGKSTTYGNFSGLADAESANFSDSTTANSLYYSGTQLGTASVNIGTSNYPAYRIPRYNNWNNQSTSANRPQSPDIGIATNNTTNAGMYSYGNYYNWSAAMANTIYYSGPTAKDANGKTSETVNTSLCPTGWRLPYGRDTGNGLVAGGFYNLNYKINNNSNVMNTSEKIRAFPNNFIYSGSFITSSVSSRGGSGSYWTSTASNRYGTYGVYLDTSHGVTPGNSYGENDKTSGKSIRCTVSAGA